MIDFISPPSGNRLARLPLLHLHREQLVFIVVNNNIVATTAFLLPSILTRQFGFVSAITPFPSS